MRFFSIEGVEDGPPTNSNLCATSCFAAPVLQGWEPFGNDTPTHESCKSNILVVLLLCLRRAISECCGSLDCLASYWPQAYLTTSEGREANKGCQEVRCGLWAQLCTRTGGQEAAKTTQAEAFERGSDKADQSYQKVSVWIFRPFDHDIDILFARLGKTITPSFWRP